MFKSILCWIGIHDFAVIPPPTNKSFLTPQQKKNSGFSDYVLGRICLRCRKVEINSEKEQLISREGMAKMMYDRSTTNESKIKNPMGVLPPGPYSSPLKPRVPKK